MPARKSLVGRLRQICSFHSQTTARGSAKFAHFILKLRQFVHRLTNFGGRKFAHFIRKLRHGGKKGSQFACKVKGSPFLFAALKQLVNQGVPWLRQKLTALATNLAAANFTLIF
uniref:Uncharacterized protein n=1 Tax=Tupiella akineta TaxID=160070 RepID=Q6UVT5_TUPAK|nr:hypothetical protein PsakpMp27 [Tupiella akineta]AAQ18739.1 hypothetical protein [Tupiella akineta]